ncbi:hypothetical protein [Azospirillum brasilense]|uniref:hypothetical protein n=1 Tax=Azospirillum brasilense TaxID=192 RepID=UPI000E69260E|nr:hypothetical protein [Azospirillum brasilense]NUB24305.1 hypothetical protein [Azospirillum brasilense]NUB34123.1 hypothetical protein [Azospirillum brasilense]RIW00989.1 hypothetical protein D2T81_19455 [Azospirillum brasilense]
MNIPAHRAAAVEPTPADSFAMTEDGKTIVNLTEQERTARAAAEQVEREKQEVAKAEHAPDPAPPAELPKPAKSAGALKAPATQTKEA